MPNKVIVFSSWTTTLDKMSDSLRRAGIHHARIDGRHSFSRRTKAIRAFGIDDGLRVLLATIGAGGEGLTLTAANHVFLLDRHWNPAVEEQAVARVYRLGQKRSVTVRSYNMKNSVESAIAASQDRKRELGSIMLRPGSVGTAEFSAMCQKLATLMK